MTRKRITERFPWLLPLRQAQRKAFFYTGLMLDSNIYTRQQRKSMLPCLLVQRTEPMVNPDSGYDIQYQYNKAYNLQVAAAKLHGLVIQPGETFSFCLAIKNADRHTPYRDGLTLVGDTIRGEYGGGLCQLSNLLYWLFLHTPLTVVERHGHGTLAIPPADPKELAGIDATVAEGWLDLKVRNETSHTFQLSVTFQDGDMCGAILCDTEKCYDYTLYNTDRRFVRRGSEIWETAVLMRRRTSCFTGKVTEETLYTETCRIAYPLPPGTVIEEETPAKSGDRPGHERGADSADRAGGVTSAGGSGGAIGMDRSADANAAD